MAFRSASAVTVEAASDDPRELITANCLRQMLEDFDLTGLQWTSHVVIQRHVIPHSHPTLTLNTRTEGDQLLATYLHEQMHWWTVPHPNFGDAINDTFSGWPEVPGSNDGGARDEHSTRLHLIVCRLEHRAMQQVLGKRRADAVLGNGMSDVVYPWIYRQVADHGADLDHICTQRQMWPSRLMPSA